MIERFPEKPAQNPSSYPVSSKKTERKDPTQQDSSRMTECKNKVNNMLKRIHLGSGHHKMEQMVGSTPTLQKITKAVSQKIGS
ncbi:MAG: hypothetical protein HYZ48_02800 [Chlamydiales bacterium]|nr:hypothetical protein [Chlamydiales bacterium]